MKQLPQTMLVGLTLRWPCRVLTQLSWADNLTCHGSAQGTTSETTKVVTERGATGTARIPSTIGRASSSV